MRTRRFLMLFALLALSIAVLRAHARETSAEHVANAYAAKELAAAPPHGNLPDYSLLSTDLAKAQHLETVRTVTGFGGQLWSLLQFVLLLWLGGIAWMRNRALSASAGLRDRGKAGRAFWRECLVFTLLFTLVGYLLDLPLTLYQRHLALAYGLSVQGWASWFADQLKSLGLSLIGSVLFFALLMWLIRRLPRAWWLVSWAVVMPMVLVLVYLSPLIIDPLFNKFEPLQQTHPELITRLEEVVKKGHMNIPPERMFLMRASAKVTTLNAYVTGFGGSKRVVIWDTSLQKGTPDQILFIFGHESGHYVLGHIIRGLLLATLGLLLAFYLGYLFVLWSLRRFGPQWRITSQSDWGVLALLFFAFALFSVALQPVINTFSRSSEHAADVYGLEAIHGIVPNPQEAASSSFVLLGRNSFVVPNPNLFLEFWTESHPALGRRAAFAKAYNPWAAGYEPKYFNSRGER